MCAARVLRAFLRETGPYECLPFSRLSPELIRLRLIMKKTENEKSMILPKQAVQILERYPSKGIIFPMLRADKIGTAAKELQERRTATRTMKKMLKSLGTASGVETPLTTSLARHSFADHVRKKGWAVYDISKALGHAKVSITENYLVSFQR